MAPHNDLEVDSAEPPARKSDVKLIVTVSAVVLLVGILATVTVVLTATQLASGDDAAAQQADAGKASDDQRKRSRARLNYVPMDPPFIVNLNGDTDTRFLQVAVDIGTRDPDVAELVKEHRPAIRNSLVLLFGNQDPHTLHTREGKEKLRSETLAEIQKVIQEETGNRGVENVFFTSFVMQ